LAYEKVNGRKCALKTVRKSFLVEQGKERHVMREKLILNTLKHPNIIELITTFQDENNLFFVFEHAENGMLEDLIKMCKRRLGEDLIKIYMA
jgi:serine/threonine protein kinase